MVADLYDNQKGYLVQPPTEVFVGVLNTDGEEAESYPLTVFNVKGKEIGDANSKEDFVRIWNADADNVAIGRLTGWVGPFEFIQLVSPNKQPVISVAGDPPYILDEDEEYILNENGEKII